MLYSSLFYICITHCIGKPRFWQANLKKIEYAEGAFFDKQKPWDFPGASICIIPIRPFSLSKNSQGLRRAEYAGKAKIVKVDIDESADLAMKYQVMSVPNMIFFKDGKPVDAVIGAVPANFLKEKQSCCIP